MRASEVVPEARLILLLRNPVDRVYSHYNHRVRVGRENRSFEQVLGVRDMNMSSRERERVTAEWLECGGDEAVCFSESTLLNWSIYADYVRQWTVEFPEEQMLVLSSEAFFADPARTVNQVLDFLELHRWELKTWPVHVAGRYSEMEATTRHRLVEYFRPHNQRLYEILNRDFGWDH
jgi:hypothetical protein